jgi:pimeloyl-ACP methyl ester carboxylesterase
MLLTVYVPLLRTFYPEANGNWDAAIMFKLLSIGIFCDNHKLMDEVYRHYRFGPVNSGITRYIYPSGQCEETCRDQGHVQLGLGYLARTSIIAWNQGVDLFDEADNRIALGYEYTASLLLGEKVQVYGKIVDTRGRFSDIYEGVLQHYRYIKDMDLPNTEKAALRARDHSRSVLSFFRGGYPPTPLGGELRPDAQGFLSITPKGIAEDFAQDLPEKEQKVLLATQGPTNAAAFGATITTAAWKTKPSWFVIAGNDRAIPPELEKAEAAKMKATLITLPSSHLAMLSHPNEVAELIEQAAAKTGAK